MGVPLVYMAPPTTPGGRYLRPPRELKIFLKVALYIIWKIAQKENKKILLKSTHP